MAKSYLPAKGMKRAGYWPAQDVPKSELRGALGQRTKPGAKETRDAYTQRQQGKSSRAALRMFAAKKQTSAPKRGWT